MNNHTVSPFVIFNFFFSFFFLRNSEKKKREKTENSVVQKETLNASKTEFRIRHILTGGSGSFGYGSS